MFGSNVIENTWVQNPSPVCRASYMLATWNSTSFSEIYADTPTLYQTNPENSRIMLTPAIQLAAKSDTVDTDTTCRLIGLCCSQYICSLLILPCFMTLCWKSCLTSLRPPSLAAFKVQCSVSYCQLPGDLPSHDLLNISGHIAITITVTIINTILSWACCYATPINSNQY